MPPTRFTYSPARMIKPGHVPTPVAKPAQGASRASARPTPRPAPLQLAPLAKKAGFGSWLGAHKVLVSLGIVVVVTASVAFAAVLWSQGITATPDTRTSPVVFAAGDQAVDLAALGFISTPSITANGASASVTVYGIPGATSLALGNILAITNTNDAGAQSYDVTLSVSPALPATITGMTITFDDDVAGTPTARSWNLKTTATFTEYSLGDGETWQLNLASLVMTAAASGSQGALTISISVTPTP